MVLGALGCMYNANYEKKAKDNIMLDVLHHLYQAKNGIGISKFENNGKFSIVINKWHRQQLLGGYVLDESLPIYTTLDLLLSLYRPLCYNCRDHCPLLQCLRTISAILPGSHSYFMV